MSSFGDLQIINKKTLGKKLLYLCVTSTMKKWIDYEQLTEYLPQVIDYEKRQIQLYSNKKNQKSAKQKFIEQKIKQSHQMAQKDQLPKAEIKYIQFVDILGYDHTAKERIILFKAFFANGKTQFMTNAEIKTIDMSALLRFYESQIKTPK